MKPPHRVPAPWWPLLGLTAAAWLPALVVDGWRFRRGARRVAQRNQARLDAALPLPMESVTFLEVTPVVEHAHAPGFLHEAAVSYRLRTDRGTLVMDLGMGTRCLEHNARALGLADEALDGVVISHLHPDHMGGLAAARKHRVALPEALRLKQGAGVFTPGPCTSAPGVTVHAVAGPQRLPAGLATTGPLDRMQPFTGVTAEQAVVAHVAGRGLVVVTGCGHPSLELILEMVGRLAPGPVYAVCGGLHLPVTASRSTVAGLQVQRLLGTGKPWWETITDADITRTVTALQRAGVRKVLPSAHDTCDHALARFQRELDAEVQVLQAGVPVRL